MAAYATTINSKLNNITSSIKEFIVEHQTYIPKDLFDTIATIVGVKGIAAGGGIAVAVGFISAIVGEGGLILDFRDHYLPEEYWKYVSYHPGPFYGYEVRSYVGEDHCIRYIEIPKNPDGTLRWDEAVYI